MRCAAPGGPDLWWRARARSLLIALLAVSATAAGASDTTNPALVRADSLSAAHLFTELEAFAGAEGVKAAAAYGDSSLECAEWLERRGYARGMLENLDGSREDAEACLAIRRSRLGPRDLRLVTPLETLADIGALQSRFASADSTHRAIIAILSTAQPVDSLRLAGCTLHYANFLATTSPRFREAVRLADRSLAILGDRSPGTPDDCFHWWNDVGVVYQKAGQDLRAEGALRRALAACEEAYGPDDLTTSIICSNLAKSLRDLGDIDGGRRLNERALGIVRRVKGERTISTARGFQNVARSCRSAGDYAASRAAAREALSIIEEAQGERSVETRWSRGLLGQLAFATGDTAAAGRYLRDALAITEERLGAASEMACVDATTLAALLTSTGRAREARELLEPRMAVMEMTAGTLHPHTIELRHQLARALLAEGRTGDAWRLALVNARAAADNLETLLGTVSERRAILYSELMARPLDLLMATAIADSSRDAARSDSTFETMLRFRGRVLDALAERRRLELAGAGDPQSETVTLADAVARVQEELASLVVRGPGTLTPAAWQAKRDSLISRRDEAESRLATQSPAWSAWLTTRDRFAPMRTRIAAALPRGAVAVQYVRYRRENQADDAAFVLGAGAPRLISLGNAAITDSLVAGYRAAISSGLRGTGAVRLAAAALYQHVWAPLFENAEHDRLVFVVPDGSLSAVDFGTLVTPRGRWLIEERPVHYLTSLADLPRIALQQQGNKRAERSHAPGTARHDLLVIADPDFDLDGAVAIAGSAEPERSRAVRTPCDRAGVHAGRLPGTAEEMKRIVAACAAHPGYHATILSGPDASEHHFESAVRGQSWIHVATHGFFLGAMCDSAPRDRLPATSDFPDAAYRENPLAMCGVLLAGCNRPAASGGAAGDGWLTAAEISSLDLTGVDWIMLSACDTGLGATTRQEGVMGLRRAIELAGASSSLVTLWEVPDTAMPALVEDLYRLRFEGRGVVEACRSAELAALDRARRELLTDNPRYWGGLVATGDWR